MTTSPPPLFPPAEWVDFGNGTAVHRADLGPCECGCRSFTVTELGTRTRVYCERCEASIRPARTPGPTPSVLLGRLDSLTGTFTPRR